MEAVEQINCDNWCYVSLLCTRVYIYSDLGNAHGPLKFGGSWSKARQKFTIFSGIGLQGFVSAVENLREFVPAVYDMTVAVSKELPNPTMIRIFRGQPSVV